MNICTVHVRIYSEHIGTSSPSADKYSTPAVVSDHWLVTEIANPG